jgi:hypothetical protein
MKQIILTIKDKYQSLSINFKQYFIWPLLIAFLTFFVTYIFSKFTEQSNKENLLHEKKLTIISDITESYQVLSYYSSFRGMIDIEQMDYAKYFKKIPNENLQMVELSIRERIKLADTMKIEYPIVYENMMIGDTKAFPFLKNIQLAKLFFSQKVNTRIDTLMTYIPITKKIQTRIKEKLKTNSIKLTEKEKSDLLSEIQKETDDKFSDLLNEMVNELE